MKRLLEVSLILVLVLVLVGLVAAATSTRNYGVQDRTADRVFGQPTFLSSAGGTSSSTFNSPSSIAFDLSKNLFVLDWGNARALRFTSTDGVPSDTTADFVLCGGSTNGSLDSGVAGISDTMITDGGGLACDSEGNIYLTHTSGNRILRFNADSDGLVRDTVADFVIGQAGYFVSYIGVSDTMIRGPRGLAFDKNGNLYVTDSTNDRVLRFNASGTGVVNDSTADLVIGAPNFYVTGNNGVSDTMVNAPVKPLIDSSGNLWIAEEINDRVTRFDADSDGIVRDTTADLAIGQSGFFASYQGTSDTLINAPNDLAIDGMGNLWVADKNNYRVLRFDASGGMVSDTTADYVIGGGDPNASFDSAVNGISDTMFNLPSYLNIDASNRLYVSDYTASRILVFNPLVVTFTDDDDCFIATAAYGHDAPELSVFHQFRDEILMSSRVGRGLVSFYYTHGPSAASYVAGDASRFVTRTALTPVLGLVKLINTLGLLGAGMFLTLIGGSVFALRRR